MVKRSSAFWILCWICVAMGIACQFTGVYLEVTRKWEVGLYLIAFATAFMCLSGIFAQLAAKYQEIEEREAKSDITHTG